MWVIYGGMSGLHPHTGKPVRPTKDALSAHSDSNSHKPNLRFRHCLYCQTVMPSGKITVGFLLIADLGQRAQFQVILWVLILKSFYPMRHGGIFPGDRLVDV